MGYESCDGLRREKSSKEEFSYVDGPEPARLVTSSYDGLRREKSSKEEWHSAMSIAQSLLAWLGAVTSCYEHLQYSPKAPQRRRYSC